MTQLSLTGQFRITGIKKKSRAKFFSDLSVGDLVKMDLPVKNLRGASGGGSYVPELTLTCRDLPSHKTTMNLLLVALVCFEYVQE